LLQNTLCNAVDRQTDSSIAEGSYVTCGLADNEMMVLMTLIISSAGQVEKQKKIIRLRRPKF